MIITEEMKKLLQESLNDRWKTPTGESKGERKDKPKGKGKRKGSKPSK